MSRKARVEDLEAWMPPELYQALLKFKGCKGSAIGSIVDVNSPQGLLYYMRPCFVSGEDVELFRIKSKLTRYEAKLPDSWDVDPNEWRLMNV